MKSLISVSARAMVLAAGLLVASNGLAQKKQTAAPAKPAANTSTAAAVAPAASEADKIDQLIREMKTAEAQKQLEQALVKTPKDAELLWRHSRTLVLLGDQEKNKDTQLSMYEKARAQAEAAIQADPKSMMGYLRRAAANGKVALFKGVLQARELVLQTRDDAQKAIELNNSTPYGLALGHYILGRTHAKLSESPKALRMPLGLQWGNLKDAEANLSKSVQLFPNSIAFRTDYGLLLKQTGKTNEAKEQLQAALALPDSDPGDPAKKAEAQAALK